MVDSSAEKRFMGFEFREKTYPSEAAMLFGMATDWLTAGGASAGADISAILKILSDEELAAELTYGWMLNEASDSSVSSGQSHMDFHRYDEAALTAAFSVVRSMHVSPGSQAPFE